METILYIGGPCCMAEARSAKQILEARVCIAEAHGVQVFPPSSGWYQGVKYKQETEEKKFPF